MTPSCSGRPVRSSARSSSAISCSVEPAGRVTTHPPQPSRLSASSRRDGADQQPTARPAAAVMRAVHGAPPVPERPLTPRRRAGALAGRVRDQPAGDGRRHGAAAGRSADRGGVQRHPAVGREPDLVPGMGVGVGDLEGAGVGVPAAGREAGRHPRRHAPHPQQQRHRAGELLAVAALGREQERVERIPGAAAATGHSESRCPCSGRPSPDGRTAARCATPTPAAVPAHTPCHMATAARTRPCSGRS